MEDWSRYVHSPAHAAVARGDSASLRRIISTLPRLAKAGEVNTEEESLRAEAVADTVSSVIDRRDVPGRETPLHLAVRLHDAVAADMLMAAGADWSLQNDRGWSALQEAVCTREENIALIIARHYQPLAWAKWCRRLPRIVATAARIRDFYMEISFHFESSVIPFIGRIAPSDTYRIWKRGSNLRADMTLAGFDGLRIQRSDQTFLFLGDGGRTAAHPPGSLIVLAHKKKEIRNALEGAGVKPTEAEVAREVALMSKTNMFRPGIDVTQAELVPQLNWRRQERTETVGRWKAKVYEMNHVVVSVKSRRVPGAMTDEELFSVDDDGDEDDDDLMTDEEKLQLNAALHDAAALEDDDTEQVVVPSMHRDREKKTWLNWRKTENEQEDGKKHGKKKKTKKAAAAAASTVDSKHESEYKKGLRPVLWLTPDFPLDTDELLPLLDIIANKVKAVRRLRELLTTKLPLGTFPVKVAIPVIPTIRVLVTFTKFEELNAQTEEFSTPMSSPARLEDSRCKESNGSSWVSWMRGGRKHEPDGEEDDDPFLIPTDYAWVDAGERKRRMKMKKPKNRRNRTARGDVGGDGLSQKEEDLL